LEKDHAQTKPVQVKQRALKLDARSFARGLNGGSHPGSTAWGLPWELPTTTRIRSPLEERSTLPAWGTNSSFPMGDVIMLRCAGNVPCGFTLSAIAVPVPPIMATAMIQPPIIFMAQSS
jgi:hypothetical protein